MLRALIVEDNRLFRDAFKAELHGRLSSLLIEEVENGEEALQRINVAHPDLIFMDMHLAGMNGLELARKIKNDFPLIRIAMLTGYDMPEYRLAASQQGVHHFFVKDLLDWEEIMEFVQSTQKNKQ
jgi:two-component system, response regulator YesN